MLVQSLRQSLADDKGMEMLISRIFERAESAVDDNDVSNFRRELFGAHGESIPEVTQHLVSTEVNIFLKNNSRVLTSYELPSN